MTRRKRTPAQARRDKQRANTAARAASPPPSGPNRVVWPPTPAAIAAKQTTALRNLVAAQAKADQAVDEEVARLRDLGAGWPVIATALGVTRQGARQRYSEL